MATLYDPRVISYRIDSANRISHVSAGWSEFAQNNHGESLLPPHVLGYKLLDAIADMTLRELYSRMIEKSRAGQTLRFHYRCDAPDRRRTFEMEIRLHDSGEVEFVSTLMQEAPRPSVALLESGRRRDERMLTVCSWCQKVKLPDRSWQAVEVAVELLKLLEAETFPQLTHGICEHCYAEVA